ncbi:MAG: Rpn family recombination-promoting nuclease/putative transposase, partial [Desulfovibrio sp.]|nr:Rpn family recombination-promoting nuclease/putative transposase [Desulfovibrio sp.]
MNDTNKSHDATSSATTAPRGNIHDSLYKLLFSHKVVIEELLRYFVPSTILGTVNFASLERCSDSFINRKGAERRE